MTKNNLLKTVVIPGTIALAALLLSLRVPFRADDVAGYGTVLFLIGIVTLEYRINWKRTTGKLLRIVGRATIL